MGEPGFAEITPNAATADILFELGMMYCIGRDVLQDYVTAHKWFNLAALKGSEDARHYRRELALEMTAGASGRSPAPSARVADAALREPRPCRCRSIVDEIAAAACSS